jgi:integral membrane protein
VERAVCGAARSHRRGGKPATLRITGRNVHPALLRYRIVAWIVSVLLIILFCVGIPLQAAGGHGGVDAVVGIAHGVLFYPLYWIFTIDLALRTRMPVVRLVLTLAAGTVPFVSFVAERETRKWVQAQQSG